MTWILSDCGFGLLLLSDMITFWILSSGLFFSFYYSDLLEVKQWYLYYWGFWGFFFAFQSFYLLPSVQLQNDSISKCCIFVEESLGWVWQNENKKAHLLSVLKQTALFQMPYVFIFHRSFSFRRWKRNVHTVCVVSGQVLFIWDGPLYLSA